MSQSSGALIPVKDHRWQVSIQYHHDIKERNSDPDTGTHGPKSVGLRPSGSILVLGTVVVRGSLAGQIKISEKA